MGLIRRPVQAVNRLTKGIHSTDSLNEHQMLHLLNLFHSETYQETTHAAIAIKAELVEDHCTSQVKSEIEDLTQWVDKRFQTQLSKWRQRILTVAERLL